MKSNVEFVIAVGSNIDPEYNIKKSRQELEKVGEILKSSKFIHTKPIGFLDQADFINGAYLFKTNLSPEKLNIELKSIEKKLGRIKTKNKNGPRTIDLDIIVSNNKVVDTDFYSRKFLQDSVFEVIEPNRLKLINL